MSSDVQIHVLNGHEARKHLGAIAELRLSVFRTYPYLYDGTLAYERQYLETYFRREEACVILCRSGERIVGASTAVPLMFEDSSMQLPFVKHGFDPREVMYFGESLLLNEFRGQGLGKRFFQERLQHALSTTGIRFAAFCAVIRPDDHAARPTGYRPLDSLWRSFGFGPVPGLTCQMSWKQIDETTESPKTLQFWIREL